jgi:hypothetical protein
MKKNVEYYRKKLEKASSPEEAQAHLDEITEILEAMDKGLAILKNAGREPEAKVLQNQAGFAELKREFSGRI